ncbi:MAG: hypothetical protein LBM78_03475, partial [Clostridiales bacterium]|nr:hypothetical protein [Clostridiales bacterium]
MTLSVDTTVTILSSRTRVYKTDAFLLATRHFRAGDAFFAAIAEAVMLHWADGFENGAFAAETADRAHTFFFVTGTAAGLNARDIVFYAYSGADAVRRGDGRLYALLRTEHFRLELKPAALPPKPGDFSKLYRLSHADYVNFPLLSAEQLAIVEKQDEHVLVQGVAGSGKTNVCIDKIVYAACEGYAGRVLYSTFSRGLLLDTRGKVAHLCESLAAFGVRHREGRLLFLDGDHKRAAENHLGLRFAAEDVTDIAKKVADVLFFLQNKVDYRLPEDFLPAGENGGVADEGYFVRAYVRGIKNHRLAGRLARIKHLSYEVVYKEIFGVIMGCCDPENPRVPLSPEAYYDRRKDSFTQPECEVIYSLARDYAAHLDEVGLTDNNRIARKLLENTPKIEYSLAVLDEVQDLTEVCLVYYRAIARKLFCVGDALQMINPAYFSFAYLKRLLYEKDIISVAALTHNYRNSRAIAALVEALSALNLKTFGTHSFVLGGVSVDTDVPTAVGRADGGLLAALADAPFGGYTVIAPSREAKERLQARLPQAEVLTVSEAKGLEREVVVLVDLLSHAADK